MHSLANATCWSLSHTMQWSIGKGYLNEQLWKWKQYRMAVSCIENHACNVWLEMNPVFFCSCRETRGLVRGLNGCPKNRVKKTLWWKMDTAWLQQQICFRVTAATITSHRKLEPYTTQWPFWDSLAMTVGSTINHAVTAFGFLLQVVLQEYLAMQQEPVGWIIQN